RRVLFRSMLMPHSLARSGSGATPPDGLSCVHFSPGKSGTPCQCSHQGQSAPYSTSAHGANRQASLTAMTLVLPRTASTSSGCRLDPPARIVTVSPFHGKRRRLCSRLRRRRTSGVTRRQRSETSGPDESPLSLLVQRRARVARTNPSARGPMDEFGNHTHRVTPTKRPAPFPMRASSCPVKVYATFVSTTEDSLVSFE